MNNLSDFAFREEYKRFAKLGDRLAEVDSLIDWVAFRPIVTGMYDNTSIYKNLYKVISRKESK